MKKLLSTFLVASMLLTAIPSAFAADITTSGGSNDVPVELTQAVTSFSVAVPTVLPVNVDADGKVSVSPTNTITNNSFGPVEVKSVQVNPQNDWTLVDFTTDFTEKKVGLTEFGFQMNGENVATDGSCSADTFQPIDGNGGTLAFTYDANVAAQKEALTNVEIAQVVFTVGWYSDNAPTGGATTYAATFADNSWSDIATACQNDEVPSTWAVGDTKAMTINGTEYNVQIIGKNHDTYADGSGTAPLTFQTVEIVENFYKLSLDDYLPHRDLNSDGTCDRCYEEIICAECIDEDDDAICDVCNEYLCYDGDNYLGWDESSLYNYMNTDLLNSIEDDVKNNIKAVVKSTNEGYSRWVANGETGDLVARNSNDKLFLLSRIEVFGSQLNAPYNLEGTQYEYYANATIATCSAENGRDGDSNSNAIKYYNGKITSWRLRTPCCNCDYDYRFVTNSRYVYEYDENGDIIGEEEIISDTIAYSGIDGSGIGITFAFCF